MSVTTISQREFDRDVKTAEEAARNGPVIITDHGRPAHVLLSIEEYQRITGRPISIVDWLAMPDAGDLDFEPDPLRGPLYQPADLS